VTSSASTVRLENRFHPRHLDGSSTADR
jgi:hypothetical protein